MSILALDAFDAASEDPMKMKMKRQMWQVESVAMESSSPWVTDSVSTQCGGLRVENDAC